MTSVALIACANGFGHIRRIVLLADALTARGVVPTIFAPDVAVKKVVDQYNLLKRTPTVDVSLYPALDLVEENFLDKLSSRWLSKLACLSDYRLVISDNLPEILSIRPDAILSGNFLWHEVVNTTSTIYTEEMSSLVRKNKPRMINYGMFSMVNGSGYIDKIRARIPQPHYGPYRPIKRGLLIACGTGGGAESRFREFLDYSLSILREAQIRPIFVEPKLMKSSYSPIFEPATFSRAMYRQVSCAIIRPGFGTISDCIHHSIRIFPLCEESNFEMEHNSSVVQALGIGQVSKLLDSLVEEVVRYLNSSGAQKDHYRIVKKLQEDQGIDASEYISDIAKL